MQNQINDGLHYIIQHVYCKRFLKKASGRKYLCRVSLLMSSWEIEWLDICMFTVTFRSSMKNISTCMVAKSLRNESRVAVSETHSIVFPKTRQGMNLRCCCYYYACDAEASYI